MTDPSGRILPSPDDTPMLAPVQMVEPYGEFIGFDFGFRSDAGVAWFMRDNGDGTWTIGCDQPQALQDAILDANHAMATHNDGWSPDKTLRRAASIPVELIADWRMNGFDIADPNTSRDLMRRLDSSDFSKVRTAHWRIGDTKA